jgi:TolB protein
MNYSEKNQMKKIYTLFLCTIITLIQAEEIELAPITLSVSKESARQTQMPIAIIIFDEKNNELNTIANTIKEDLAFTDQFKPYIKKCDADIPKKELRKNIQQLANAGTPLALCIKTQSPQNIEWRLYDTMQCTMLQGKKYKKRGTAVRGWAHGIADEVRKTLTGSDPIFSSKLAYCKDAQDAQGHTIRKIYIADFDGNNEELLVDLSSIAIAPRWHIKKPELFYSEYTDTNVQLKSIDVKKGKKKKIVQEKTIPPFETSITMYISFYENGQDYVFCASRGNGSCQIYLNKNDNLKRCTKNIGNNISPIVMDKERICFCSDFQKGNPQLYIGNIETGHLQRFTKGGYCTSPSYCPKNNKIAYHMMIQGTMQIMLYDCVTKIHAQFTSSAGNKHEASWSPDGTYLLYSHEQGYNKSRLVSSNVLTNTTKYLTSANDYCSYPHWSPCYQTFPVVT